MWCVIECIYMPYMLACSKGSVCLGWCGSGPLRWSHPSSNPSDSPSIDSWIIASPCFLYPEHPRHGVLKRLSALVTAYNLHNSLQGLRSDYVCRDFNDQTYWWIIFGIWTTTTSNLHSKVKNNLNTTFWTNPSKPYCSLGWGLHTPL